MPSKVKLFRVAFVYLLKEASFKISEYGFYRFENETRFNMS
jgi:hypothetical protein